MSEFILHDVIAIEATDTDGIYKLIVDATDASGRREITDYLSRPEGTIGLNPKIRTWLAAHPDFPIAPYVPPCLEEIRTSMLPLDARQFRLGFLSAGVAPSQITALISSMPAGAEKERLQIEWEYARSFDRSHDLVAAIASAMSLTAEQIDAIWRSAITL